MRLFDQNIWGNFSAKHTVGNRMEMVRELIEGQQPKIICFQECNPSTVRAGETGIVRMLSGEYREVCPQKAGVNFTPILLRTGEFDSLEEGYFPFSGPNDLNSKSVTYAVLRQRKTGRRFAVASVHFWWQTGPRADAAREQNAGELAELAGRLQREYGVSLLVCGDFNSGFGTAPQGPAGIGKMKELGFSDARLLARESTDTPTCREAYPQRLAGDRYAGGTAPSYILDYGFVFGKSLQINRFSVLTDQAALDCSDHCPLVLDFEVS